jgi:hypothetical protein
MTGPSPPLEAAADPVGFRLHQWQLFRLLALRRFAAAAAAAAAPPSKAGFLAPIPPSYASIDAALRFFKLPVVAHDLVSRPYNYQAEISALGSRSANAAPLLADADQALVAKADRVDLRDVSGAPRVEEDEVAAVDALKLPAACLGWCPPAFGPPAAAAPGNSPPAAPAAAGPDGRPLHAITMSGALLGGNGASAHPAASAASAAASAAAGAELDPAPLPPATAAAAAAAAAAASSSAGGGAVGDTGSSAGAHAAQGSGGGGSCSDAGSGATGSSSSSGAFSLAPVAAAKVTLAEAQPPLIQALIAAGSEALAGGERPDTALQRLSAAVLEMAMARRFKTKLCHAWLRSGGRCPRGLGCPFAHGEQELRINHVSEPPLRGAGGRTGEGRGGEGVVRSGGADPSRADVHWHCCAVSPPLLTQSVLLLTNHPLPYSIPRPLLPYPPPLLHPWLPIHSPPRRTPARTSSSASCAACGWTRAGATAPSAPSARTRTGCRSCAWRPGQARGPCRPSAWARPPTPTRATAAQLEAQWAWVGGC